MSGFVDKGEELNNKINTQSNTDQRITITLDVCDKGIFLNGVTTATLGDCSLYGTATPIKQTTSANDIAGLLGGLNVDLSMLKLFQDKYSNVSPSQSTVSNKNFEYYERTDHYDDVMKVLDKMPDPNAENVDVPEVLIYLSQLRKTGNYNQTLHNELYDLVNAENPDKDDWGPTFLSLYKTEKHGKVRPKFLRRDHDKSVKDIIQEINKAFDKLFNDKDQKIPKAYKDALEAVRDNINNGINMLDVFKYEILVTNIDYLKNLRDNLKKIYFVAIKQVPGIKEDGEFKYPPTYCEKSNTIKRKISNGTFKKHKLSCKKGEESLADYEMNNFIKFLFLTSIGDFKKNDYLKTNTTLFIPPTNNLT
jgi:hypothetical protein